MHYYKSFFETLLVSVGMGMGGESGLLFGNKWELDYSLRFSKGGNGNGNEVIYGNGREWVHESQSFPYISNV